MDATTRAVRAMYEQYPYPTGTPTWRAGSDVRWAASLLAETRPNGRAARVLDAGCGRGLGLLGSASLQRNAHFLGIDLNRVALAEVAAEAARRKLDNVRVQEIDLMTLEGLEAPEGGFDLIHSSGVLHHLSDPAAGLARLVSVLAPHGLLSVMVYGRRGREPLYRLARAIDALCPRDQALERRLQVGRALARAATGDSLRAGPWTDVDTISDVEFVDRYLKVHETSYDIEGLFALLESAGLRFLRWIKQRDWSLEALPDGELRARAAALDPVRRFQLVDALCWRPSYEFFACKRGARSRAALERSSIPSAVFAVHPEVTFEIEKRQLRGQTRIERIAYRLQGSDARHVPAGPLASALVVLSEQNEAFPGTALLEVLRQKGADEAQSLELLQALVDAEVLYRPHSNDL